ncbi:hypothetical protein [Streptomyces sp. NPDC050422]|uniref:hypothetical protein n=1 Tax=Streptomyces sp. NPDC050422 TaxID=3365614 RepID=UPI0037ACA023
MTADGAEAAGLVVFADEPTGALDRVTGHESLTLLCAGVDGEGQTCVSDPRSGRGRYADRVRCSPKARQWTSSTGLLLPEAAHG